MSPVQRPNDDLVEPLFAGLRGSETDPENGAGTDPESRAGAHPQSAVGPRGTSSKRWILLVAAVAVLLLALVARSLFGGDQASRGTGQQELTPPGAAEESEPAGS